MWTIDGAAKQREKGLPSEITNAASHAATHAEEPAVLVAEMTIIIRKLVMIKQMLDKWNLLKWKEMRTGVIALHQKLKYWAIYPTVWNKQNVQ